METDFALWISHKTSLFFPNSELVHKLNAQLVQIDQQLTQLSSLNTTTEPTAFNTALTRLDEMVKEMALTLSLLVDHSISMDSGRDPLTKLLNRQFLDTVLQRETHYCMMNKNSYLILMIDIDHFKHINDNYGHMAGDLVLEQIGDVLSNCVRGGDFIFRYGGEEFLIVLTDMKLAFIDAIADQLLNNVRQHAFKIDHNKQLHCTISIGVAQHQGHPDYHRVLNHADQALYQAKHSGRNQYVVYKG